MARLKREDKIRALAKKQCVSPMAFMLLNKFILESQDGCIKDYSENEKKYIKEVFNNCSDNYTSAFVELWTGKELIKYNKQEDSVYIRVFSNVNYNNALVKLKNKKRKYIRDSEKQSLSLNNSLFSGKYGNLLSFKEAHEGQDININLDLQGIKIPDILFPYFTSEDIKEQDVNTYLSLGNIEGLSLEQKRRNLTKEQKRTYFACMAAVNTDGIIEDFSINSFVDMIKNEFGDKAITTSTMYVSIKVLIDLGLLIEYIDPKGHKCLQVAFYGEAFKQKCHYVIVPNTVLKRAFKKLQASSIKLFFHFLFMLNNGEEKNKYIGQSKAIYFKVANLSGQTKETKKKFFMQQLWLKKRYPGELLTLLWGKIDEDFNALGEFFNFVHLDETVLQVRVRREYFISKKATKLKKILALKGKKKQKLETIKESLTEFKIPHDQSQVWDLLKILMAVENKHIKDIFRILALKIKEKKEKGWEEIRNIPAYVSALKRDYLRESAALDG